MVKLSILELGRVRQGSDRRAALDEARALAVHAEAWGYERLWVAEHHNMPAVTTAATALVIQHIAAGTKRIRVGAGGIMLPNHAPYVIAEQFGTLETLFPGRIDLGLGRAPGTDQLTLRALRRDPANAEYFPRDVLELQAYLGPVRPGERIEAVPGSGTQVPLWILGSSLFGAQLAAMLGLPYAFASHFAPAQMMDAIALYRARFKPSSRLDKPHVMLGFNVFAADTDDEARYLATSWQQSFVNLRTGRPGRLPPPVEGYVEALPPQGRELLDHVLSCAAIGAPDTVADQVRAFIERTGADELMLTCNMYEHSARLRSYEIVAGLIETPASAA